MLYWTDQRCNLSNMARIRRQLQKHRTTETNNGCSLIAIPWLWLATISWLSYGSVSHGASGPDFVCSLDHRGSHYRHWGPAQHGLAAWEWAWLNIKLGLNAASRLTKVSRKIGYIVQRWFTAALIKTMTLGTTTYSRWGWEMWLLHHLLSVSKWPQALQKMSTQPWNMLYWTDQRCNLSNMARIRRQLQKHRTTETNNGCSLIAIPWLWLATISWLSYGSVSHGASGPDFVCSLDHRGSHYRHWGPAQHGLAAWEWAWLNIKLGLNAASRLTKVSRKIGYIVQRWFTAALIKTMTLGTTTYSRWGWESCETREKHERVGHGKLVKTAGRARICSNSVDWAFISTKQQLIVEKQSKTVLQINLLHFCVFTLCWWRLYIFWMFITKIWLYLANRHS